MSDYLCDICSKKLLRTSITFHPAATLHRAIHAGLNPWKTPGIDMSVSTRVGAAFGLGSDQQYPHWRQRSLADTTDWGLCPGCTQAIGRLSTPAPTATQASPRRDYGDALAAALEAGRPRPADGVATFEAQIVSDPETAEKRFWLGAAYLTAAGGEGSTAFLDRAIESFQRALQLDPKHKNSYAKLLGAYMSKGDDGGVRETAMRWARIDPDLPPDARRWLREQEHVKQVGSPAISNAVTRGSSKPQSSRKWWQFWR